MPTGFLIAQTGSWSRSFLGAAGLAGVILYFLAIPDPIAVELPAADPAVRHTGV